MKRAVLGAVAAALLLAGWYVYRLALGVPLDINHFADRNAIIALQGAPELLTMVGLMENTPLDFHSDRLSDLSPTRDQEAISRLDTSIADLDTYDREALDDQRRLTYDYLRWTYGAKRALYEFSYHFDGFLYAGPYPANQTQGVQELPLSTLSGFQQVVDEASAERYLARMAAVPAFLDSLETAVLHRESLGVLPPQIVVTRLIDRATVITEMPSAEWAAYTAFVRHLEALDMEPARLEALSARNLELIDTVVRPAYQEYLAFMQVLLERAPAAVGLWSLPDGDAYYQELLRYYTTTDLSPGEIHELGLARVADLSEQMDAALRELGYADGDVAARLEAFVNSPAVVWEDVPGVREAILDEYRRLNDELQDKTASMFRGMPPQALEIRRVPVENELGAAGAYYWPPALDGTRPGIFYVNLRDISGTQRFAMRTLAAHEGIPGHHFETATGQQLEGVPLVRRQDYIAAHSEGWALYAERLVAELGLHDAFSDLGRLQAEMFRAVRLVVDTGIHARGWTREQSIDYMMAHTGMPEVDVISEIERYIANPGQACAYMVGMLEILELREEARERQGERFDLPAFHQVMIGNGALPLAVLRAEAERQLQ